MRTINSGSQKDKARGVEPQVEASHYFRKEYDSKSRFISYWHQIEEILLLEPQSLLEVGIGNGLVSIYLRQREVNIMTLDIDEGLNPDRVGSVLAMPFADNSFEVVTCYQVLEHLPYEDLPAALTEIRRVLGRYAVLSLPDSTRVYRLDIQIPKIGELKKLIALPRLRTPKHEFGREHYWEIGKAGYPLRKVMGEIRKAGFEITKSYRVFENPRHRFFVLRKSIEGKAA